MVQFSPSDLFAIGGVVAVGFVVIVIWLIAKSIKQMLLWGALGGPSLFQIFGDAAMRYYQGDPAYEILQELPLRLMFFLRPLDLMVINDAYEMWTRICIALVLCLWFIILLGFISSNIVTPQFALAPTLVLFYILTGTAEGVRTMLAQSVPALSSILMPAYGLYALGIAVVLAVVPILIINIVTGKFFNPFAPAEAITEALT